MSTSTVAFWSVIGGMAVSSTFVLKLPEVERELPANMAKGYALLFTGIFFTAHLIYLLHGARNAVEALRETRGMFYLLYGWMAGGYCAAALIAGLFGAEVSEADRFAGYWGLWLIVFTTLEILWARWRAMDDHE